MKNFTVFLLMAMLSGMTVSCCARRPVVNSVSTIDTIWTTETITHRDTVFVTKPSSSSIRIPADQISDLKEEITRQSDNSRLSLSRKNDTIYIDCDCDSIQLKAQIQDKTVTTDHLREKMEIKTVLEKYIPGWVKFLAWAGAILLLLTVGVVVRQIIRK